MAFVYSKGYLIFSFLIKAVVFIVTAAYQARAKIILLDLVPSFCDGSLSLSFFLLLYKMGRADNLCAGIEDDPYDDVMLQEYLTHYPEFSPPIDLIPSDEHEERLDIAVTYKSISKGPKRVALHYC